jgi:hypothetical protein
MNIKDRIAAMTSDLPALTIGPALADELHRRQQCDAAHRRRGPPHACAADGAPMTAAQDILGGRAAVLLALLDGPARAVTLHDRIRARVGKLLAVVRRADGRREPWPVLLVLDWRDFVADEARQARAAASMLAAGRAVPAPHWSAYRHLRVPRHAQPVQAGAR